MKKSKNNSLFVGISATAVAVTVSLLGLPASARTPVQYQGESAAPIEQGQNLSYQTTPFDLSELAYRGYFKAQGIPAYVTLRENFRAGLITAKDVVQAGVEAHKISADTLNNQEYIHAVKSELRNLARRN